MIKYKPFTSYVTVIRKMDDNVAARLNSTPEIDATTLMEFVITNYCYTSAENRDVKETCNIGG